MTVLLTKQHPFMYFNCLNFQSDILESAKEENVIACLGTGTGKTFIAVLLIREMSHELRPPFEEGGKRTIFLVPTVPLVTQQKDVLKKHTDLKIGEYFGSMGVDLWSNEQWQAEIRKHEVLVMVAEVFKNILNHAFLSLDRVNLIVFDECHRAVGYHPYKEIMKHFDHCPEESFPKIFGLTASILNGKCNLGQLELKINQLELTLRSRAIIASSITSINKFGTKPKEVVVKYNDVPDKTLGVLSTVKLELEKLESLKVEGPRYEPIEENIEGQQFSFLRDCKRIVLSVLEIVESMGIWCGHEAMKSYLSEVETQIYRRMLPEQQEEKIHLQCLKSAFEKSNRLLYDYLSSQPEEKSVLTDVPHKMRKLLNILLENQTQDETCCIIFVQKRLIAYMLSHWLQKISEYENYQFLKVNFVVGHGANVNGEKELKQATMMNKMQAKILKSFREKEINTLVASSVIEEGMDVPRCNLVIRYDPPSDFRSYIQSKGRARAESSRYAVLLPCSSKIIPFIKDLNDYVTIEKELLSKCIDRPVPTDADIEKHMNDDLKSPYMPDKPGKPRITMSSSIPLLCLYCSKLPGDKFTPKSPRWKIIEDIDGENEKEYHCQLSLPMNSFRKEPIKGEKMPTKQAAKMAAALEAGKLLHMNGELDDHHFIPIGHEVVLSDDEDEHDSVEGKAGTKKRRRFYTKQLASPLYGEPPSSKNKDVTYNIYRIKMDLIKPNPGGEGRPEHLSLNQELLGQCFALITSKALPKICPFIIFSRLGKINVQLDLLPKSVALKKSDVQKISEFQENAFIELLDIEKSLFIYDPLNAGFAFYLIAISKGPKSKNWKIDWDFMNSVIQKRTSNLSSLSKKIGKENCFKFENKNFYDKVVQPVYNTDEKKETFYVLKVQEEKLSSHEFDTNSYASYEEYYFKRYNLKLKPEQPMLEVFYCDHPISAVPKYLDRFGVVRTTMNRYEKTISLPPQFSVILSMTASMRRMLVCIPLILHRINSLFLLEQLRWDISVETGVGKDLIRNGCAPIEFDWVFKQADVSKSSTYPLGGYVDHHKNQLLPMNSDYPSQAEMETLINSRSKFLDACTNLNLDQDLAGVGEIQPLLKDMLASVTAIHADDFVNLERFETVGDAFLKYAVSFYYFHKYPREDEGKLTSRKMQQISNANLCKLGIKKGLGNLMIYSKFEPAINWIPPGFRIPKDLQDAQSNSLFKKHHGTSEELEKIFIPEKCNLRSAQFIPDKSIADCVESLIGCYVTTCNIPSALLFMKWMGLRVIPEIGHLPPPLLDDTTINRNKMDELLLGFDKLEERIGYTFKNRAYLLQAFTHSSYLGWVVTDCYQRLEFLGDAVLDYIITRHLYSDPMNYGPGELSDLRMALVNNVTFAILSIKYGLHNHMKYATPGLLSTIDTFARKMEESTTKDLLEEIFLEEDECTAAAEEMEVPKALGDLIESLAGAIFLDSNRSFDTVWRVFGTMMKPELEHFREKVPKNPIRQLFEKFAKDGNVEFKPPEETTSGKMLVTVIINGKEKFCGIGKNKKCAKLTAAKRALKNFSI